MRNKKHVLRQKWHVCDTDFKVECYFPEHGDFGFENNYMIYFYVYLKIFNLVAILWVIIKKVFNMLLYMLLNRPTEHSWFWKANNFLLKMVVKNWTCGNNQIS